MKKISKKKDINLIMKFKINIYLKIMSLLIYNLF
jgi:hypothetical protein